MWKRVGRTATGVQPGYLGRAPRPLRGGGAGGQDPGPACCLEADTAAGVRSALGSECAPGRPALWKPGLGAGQVPGSLHGLQAGGHPGRRGARLPPVMRGRAPDSHGVHRTPHPSPRPGLGLKPHVHRERVSFRAAPRAAPGPSPVSGAGAPLHSRWPHDVHADSSGCPLVLRGAPPWTPPWDTRCGGTRVRRGLCRGRVKPRCGWFTVPLPPGTSQSWQSRLPQERQEPGLNRVSTAGAPGPPPGPGPQLAVSTGAGGRAGCSRTAGRPPTGPHQAASPGGPSCPDSDSHLDLLGSQVCSVEDKQQRGAPPAPGLRPAGAGSRLCVPGLTSQPWSSWLFLAGLPQAARSLCYTGTGEAVPSVTLPPLCSRGQTAGMPACTLCAHGGRGET